MKAIVKLKNKQLYLDWEFGYDKIPTYIKVHKYTVKLIQTKIMKFR